MIQGYEFFNLVKAQCHMRQLMNNAGDTILAIEFPEGDKVRSRTVVSRSRARPTGKYPSWKMGRMVQWESHNELNAYRILDANPAVKGFFEQPLAIHYCLDGEPQVHYPDVLVEFRTGRELWEIKPASEALKPENVARTRFMTAALPNHGFAYRMVLGEDLRREPRLSNVLTLLKYGRQPVGALEREQLRLLIEETGGLYWGNAASGELGPRWRFFLARLALEGGLTVDIESPLGPNSRFTANPDSKGV